MTAICLIGGKLQGFEVTYLARKAGIDVVLIDKREKPLIKDLVDRFYCFDITADPQQFIEISKTVDGIIPVNENLETIDLINNIKDRLHCPVLFDFDAYHVSMDKKRSKDYFKSIDIPIPQDEPTGPPYFVKPPCESSSVGTSIIYDERSLEDIDPAMLVEEYVEGDVISLEIIGDGENFAVVKETKVHIDGTYDCHMITPIPHNPYFREVSHKLAKNLSLKGIMDVEAIDSPKGLKVIEIDARFPSQTPTAVYHSSGINLLELLLQAFNKGVQEIEKAPQKNHCTFEHVMIEDGKLIPVGEHILSMGTDYSEYHNEEGLEIFKCDGKNTVFTLICWGADGPIAQERRKKGFEIIRDRFNVDLGDE